MERRNPYVILGVPYGASRDEATKAFARRGKSLRRQGERGRELLTDLSWALSEIENGPPDRAADATVYRLPAEPEPREAGVFAPPPEQFATTAEELEAALRLLQMRAAHEHLRQMMLDRSATLPPPGP